MRARIVAGSLLGAGLIAAGVGGWSSQPGGDDILFSRTRMYIEFNATDSDVGVQVSMDGEPWRKLQVFQPDGKLIMEVSGRRSLALQGFTELFFESSEPSLSQLPLPIFLARFPEGEYEFEGITLGGQQIEGTAIFTHAIPQKPIVLTPVEGSVVNPNGTIVTWLPVPNPPGSEIVAYQVTVTEIIDVFPKRVFSVHVPASILSVKVPPAFMRHGAEYEFEVLALEEGGNQTIHASFFTTTP